MFGFGKNKRIKELQESIGLQLRDILASTRVMNGGNIPDSLKANNYVLGFHYMMCVHLYYFAVKGKVDTEEQGFILVNSLVIALEIDAHDIAQRTERLMANPDNDFTRGMEDAKVAFEKMHRGDPSGIVTFNMNIRST